jgi:hypothetical protein
MCFFFLFEVLTAEAMKSSIFRGIILCSTVKATNVSEEHITSAFRAKDYAKQVLPALSRFCSKSLHQASILEMLLP